MSDIEKFLLGWKERQSLKTPDRDDKTIINMLRVAFNPVENNEKKESKVLGDIHIHKVVDLIWNCDKFVLRTVSPKSYAFRPYIKLPLFSIIAELAILNAVCYSTYKLSLELIKTEGLTALSANLFILGILLNLVQLWLFNIAMRFYDQLEIIPIFQVSWIIFNMLFGLLLLEEGECYTRG